VLRALKGKLSALIGLTYRSVLQDQIYHYGWCSFTFLTATIPRDLTTVTRHFTENILFGYGGAKTR
jgi:hypothetical protein